MAAYRPVALSTLRGSLARDLRDPIPSKTFSTLELNDLLNQAMVEVGRIYPKELVREYSISLDGQEQITCDASSVFRVEIVRDGAVQGGIAQTDHGLHSQSGWDLHGGILWLPLYARGPLKVADSPTIRVWGYWDRELMYDDTDMADVDAEGEFGVRTYAALLGYQRLQNDKMLFQQWLTNTGNTDVSPNQLAQTADMYQSQWREMRQRFRRLQRT
jgi:hypothetical protein